MNTVGLLFKSLIVVFVYFTIVHGSGKENIKDKIEEVLGKDGRPKRVVNVVSERSEKLETGAQADADSTKDGSTLAQDKTVEKGQDKKATRIGKKADDKKKHEEHNKKRASGLNGDGNEKSDRTAKSSKKTDQAGKVKHEKVKRGQKTNINAEQSKQQEEEKTESVTDRVLHTLSDFKNLILGPIGLGSKTNEDVAAASPPVADENTATATKKSGAKEKKKTKATGDL